MEKVNLYVDGFNLYFGMREKFGHRFKWLDLTALAVELCKSHQQVGAVKYFTARIKGPDRSKVQHQSDYLDALETQGVQIIYGKYQDREVECKFCGKTYRRYEEKESDVNLGTHLLLDAVANEADVFVVVSGDSDLIAPMRAVKERFNKSIVPVFPPNRHSNDIVQRIGRPVFLNRAILSRTQLPFEVVTRRGHKIRRPKKWNSHR